MNYDDSQRMNSNGRKPMGGRYETNSNYSPSSNYHFGSHGSSSQQNSFQGANQHPRRRNDRFKRESLNHSDRLTRQNDLIIKLLREIRDRLPPPPQTTSGIETALEQDLPGKTGSGDFQQQTDESSEPDQYQDDDDSGTNGAA